MSASSWKVAIVGGTGDLGSGLAKRWAPAGHAIFIGSRVAERAEAFARALNEELGTDIVGLGNREAAGAADIVVIAVPYSSHVATLEELGEACRDKMVIDAVVPLFPPRVSVAQTIAEGSAAAQAAGVLGPDVTVVSALHTVGATKLHAGDALECDVLVFGDNGDAKRTAIALIDQLGARGVDGGALANSVAAETMTAVLIGINRRYKVRGAGVRITGLPLTGLPQG